MFKISVAMTTYNGARFVEKQLASLLAQTRPADEVIILDDRSTDGTPDIVTRFLKKNSPVSWHFSVNEKNLGYKENFYHAVGRTTGDLIFLCDQDDVWHSNKIEAMEKLFSEHPDMKSLNTGFRFIDGDGRPIPFSEKKNWCNNGLIHKALKPEALVKISAGDIIRHNISPGCTSAFTKDIREQYLGNSARSFPHDWEINTYAALRGGLYYDNEALTNYRIHQNNTIGLKTEQNSAALGLQGGTDVRKKVLADQIGYLRLFQSESMYRLLDHDGRRYFKRVERFIRAREDCLEKHKFTSWLKLCFYYPIVSNGVTICSRGLLGDLIYALNLQRHFQPSKNDG